MAKNKNDTDDSGDVTDDELAAMGHSLKRMAYVHAQIAAWMKQHGVKVLRDTNLKTARRGLNWQWAFLASVLKAYGLAADEAGVKASFDDAAMQTIFDSFMRAKQNDSRPGEKGS